MVFSLIFGAGLTAMGVAVSLVKPRIKPVFAESKLKVSNEELMENIEKAKEVDNLKIHLEESDIEGLFKEKDKKLESIYLKNGKQLAELKRAVDMQNENNKDFIEKSNNPNFLLRKHKKGFSKDKIIDFMKNNGHFDYAGVNDLDLHKCKSFEAHAEKIDIKEVEGYVTTYYSNRTDNRGDFILWYGRKAPEEGGIYKIKEGSYFLFRDAFADKKTGKSVDVSFKIKSMVRNGKSGMDIIGFNRNGDWTNFGDIQKVVWDIDYDESGTGNPIKLDILYNSMDVDISQKISVLNASKVLVSEKSTVKINGNSAEGTVLLKPDEVRGWALFICRNVSHQEIAWEETKDNKKWVNWAMVLFGPSGMEFNEPVKKSELVNLTMYNLKIINADIQKAYITYIDRDMGGKIIREDKIEGHGGEDFIYDEKTIIEGFYNKGYDLVSCDYPRDKTSKVYDMDIEIDQKYTILLKHHIEYISFDKPKKPEDKGPRKEVNYEKGLDECDLNKDFSRIIVYKYEDGEKALEDVNQKERITRNAKFNYVTKKIEYTNWTETKLASVDSPKISGFRPDKESVDEVKINFESEVGNEEVIYRPLKIRELKPRNKGVGKRKDYSGNRHIKGPNTGDARKIPLCMAIIAACGSFVLFLLARGKSEI